MYIHLYMYIFCLKLLLCFVYFEPYVLHETAFMIVTIVMLMVMGIVMVTMIVIIIIIIIITF